MLSADLFLVDVLLVALDLRVYGQLLLLLSTDGVLNCCQCLVTPATAVTQAHQLLNASATANQTLKAAVLASHSGVTV
jgi:hypothetical protein